MNAMEYNNRERLKRIEDAPASEMSIRDRMAVDILAAMISNRESVEEDLDKAIAIAESLIEKLNRKR